MNNRNPYWDNLKMVLIFLVVLGHFIIPVVYSDHITAAIYYFIYLFHMPAFVFVSGFFSKRYTYRDNKEYTLVGYLTLYIVFSLCIMIVKYVFTHQLNVSVLLRQSGAPWYMLAMFFWCLLIPFISSLSPTLVLPLAFFLALIVGAYPECGSFLSLSRTIVFFPFFLMGSYFDDSSLRAIRPWMRVCSAVTLLCCFLLLSRYYDVLSNFQSIVYGEKSYSSLGFSNMSGLLIRAIWYLVAVMMTLCLMCLIPDKQLTLTYIGERTLGIYFVHRILRDVFTNLGLYGYFTQFIPPIVFCIIASIAMVFISSGRYTSECLRHFFHLTPVMRNRSHS